MIPLWTITSDSLFERIGWAFTSLGSPWVAHLVWPIPIFPSREILFLAFLTNFSTLPLVLQTFRFELYNATPELS
jgi:hypothetical protein